MYFLLRKKDNRRVKVDVGGDGYRSVEYQLLKHLWPMTVVMVTQFINHHTLRIIIMYSKLG
jgi:hypothetical protein